MNDEAQLLEVSRRINASARRIFEIVANPQRHADFDGSEMLRGAGSNQPITKVGDIFTMKMHRLGRDYEMINYVVEFEPDRLIVWEPAPGDVDTAGGDPTRIGVASGYRWGYRLTPSSDDATDVTEFFDCGSEENRWILLQEGGQWINGTNPVVESMAASLERLQRASTA